MKRAIERYENIFDSIENDRVMFKLSKASVLQTTFTGQIMQISEPILRAIEWDTKDFN